MDKSTLSNYGWIVICVLVLAVMIALATPFGSYIATAVENTTQGLFDVSQKAGAIAGLNLPDQSFEDNGGGSTPEPPAPIPVVGSATFSDGTTLTWEELKLAENGTKYGYNASKITDTEIGGSAFHGCTALTSIDLPDSIMNIYNYAFYECSGLADKDGFVVVQNVLYDYFGDATDVTVPAGVTEIGCQAFLDYTILTSVNLPDSITSIGINAFRGCTSLTSIDLSRCTSLTSIGNWAFYHCTSLTSIDLSRCTSLTTIGNIFPDSITSIDLPDSITTIGDYAFSDYTSLTSVDLSGCTNLTSIGKGVFFACRSLTSIDLPDSITSIGYGAFAGCTSLSSINYAGSMDDWGNITLGDYWNENVPATEVICSDGDVTL